MSSKINIHNLFNILHPFWIHHTKNWILLSKQYEHLQMAYIIKLFHTLHQLTQRTITESSCPENMHIYKYQ
jgi:hypothetical protein